MLINVTQPDLLVKQAKALQNFLAFMEKSILFLQLLVNQWEEPQEDS